MSTALDRLRHLANWCNLTTPVGLWVALAGGAAPRREGDGLFVAEGYRWPFPRAGAFTIGDVVITASTMDALERSAPGVRGHEKRHATQYAVAGVWFLPAYLACSGWSLVRVGHPALGNPFERHAGLVTGGYLDATGVPLVTPWRGRRLRRWSGRSDGGRNGAPGAPSAGDADA